MPRRQSALSWKLSRWWRSGHVTYSCHPEVLPPHKYLGSLRANLGPHDEGGCLLAIPLGTLWTRRAFHSPLDPLTDLAPNVIEGYTFQSYQALRYRHG